MMGEKKQAAAWKPFILVFSMVSLAKILHPWFSEAMAWGLAGFLSTMLVHLVPPKSPLTLVKVVLLSAATAIFLFVFTKLIG